MRTTSHQINGINRVVERSANHSYIIHWRLVYGVCVNYMYIRTISQQCSTIATQPISIYILDKASYFVSNHEPLIFQAGLKMGDFPEYYLGSLQAGGGLNVRSAVVLLAGLVEGPAAASKYW